MSVLPCFWELTTDADGEQILVPEVTAVAPEAAFGVQQGQPQAAGETGALPTLPLSNTPAR